MKRRGLLLLGTAGVGALIVGWGVLPARSRLGAGALLPTGDAGIALNGWIRIGPDGGVVLAMPRSELGQGVHTSLPMLAAEELDVPLAAVRIEQAGADAIYGNVAMLQGWLPFAPGDAETDGFNRAKVRASRWLVGKVARELGINATGGSSSVADLFEVIRTAAATARASLLGAASLQWHLPVDELAVTDGVIRHVSGKSARYGELARLASATPPGEVRLKDRAHWKVIGTPAPRLDVPAKVDGSARFGLDVRLPGMKFAAVRMCPMLGGAPGRVDADRALAMPGAERLVMLPSYAGSTAGFAVVGRTTWQAREAALTVDVDWQQRPAGALQTSRIEEQLREQVRSGDGHVFRSIGDIGGAEKKAARIIEAWYVAPYLAHATMEPPNCTARVAGGQVEVWAPTQVPGLCRAAAAQVAGVPESAVTVHVMLAGGGFGRRLEVDHVVQAVRVAMDCGEAPVQLVWAREEDMTHDFYRPMQVARLRAAIDADGHVSGLSVKTAGDAISPRWVERNLPVFAGPVDLPDKTTDEGVFDQPYAFGHQRMEHVATHMGVPVGYWRSVGHSHNAFFLEGFIDELASATGSDPVTFRLGLLQGAPRHAAVLQLAAAKSGWGSPLPQGRARGVALHESFGSIVAQVAEVSIVNGAPRVHRVVCAADVGTVVNPGVVAQQMEGAVVFGLSAALHGRVDVESGAVLQRNFPESRIVGFTEAPLVETWLVPSDRPPAGVGEIGVPPIAPAVASAMRALTGTRQRRLPLGSPEPVPSRPA